MYSSQRINKFANNKAECL